MPRTRRLVALLAGAITATAVLAAPPSRAVDEISVTEVTFASRRGPNQLTAIRYAPANPPAGALPAVALAPGGGGDHEGIAWAGRALAEAGYVAVVTGPGSGAECAALDRLMLSCANEDSIDAIRAGIDYLLSDDNPYVVDPARIGVAGYSLGARAASYVQMVDERVAAVVAFDNLATDVEGDRSSASGSTVAKHAGRSTPITPRVPAMGQASDGPGATNPLDTGADLKQEAWKKWRAAGLPVVQLVFRDTGHLTYGGNDEWAPRFAYYTVAWFDRWLKGDETATDRILAAEVLGVPRAELLSVDFHSGVFLPASGVDCSDFNALAEDRTCAA